MRLKPTPEQLPYFLPARLGGIGAGFTRGRDKRASRDYLGAINPGNSLSERPNPARVSPQGREYVTSAIDAEAVRARARAVSLGLLSRLEQLQDSMDVGDTVDALNAAGKLTGVQVTTQQVTGSVAHLHLDALRQLSAERRLHNEVANATARITAPATVDAKVIDDNELAESPEGSVISREDGEAEESLGRS